MSEDKIIRPAPKYWSLFEIQNMFLIAKGVAPRVTSSVKGEHMIWAALVLKDSTALGYEISGEDFVPVMIDAEGNKYLEESGSMSKLLVEKFGIPEQFVSSDAHYRWFVAKNR